GKLQHRLLQPAYSSFRPGCISCQSSPVCTRLSGAPADSDCPLPWYPEDQSGLEILRQSAHKPALPIKLLVGRKPDLLKVFPLYYRQISAKGYFLPAHNQTPRQNLFLCDQGPSLPLATAHPRAPDQKRARPGKD